MAAPTLQRPTDHPLARALWPHLVADVHEQLLLAVKVALLAEVGLTRPEIAERLGASPAELRGAWRQLERVGHDVAQGRPPTPHH